MVQPCPQGKQETKVDFLSCRAIGWPFLGRRGKGGGGKMTWTLEERRRRREKLQAWLAPPDANGKGAGPLFRKSYQEIAAALSQEFNRKISKWSARDYVRTLWQLEERKARLHVGGRPSMPGRVTENLDEALTEKLTSPSLINSTCLSELSGISCSSATSLLLNSIAC